MSGQVLESLHDVVSAEHPTYIGGGTDIMPLLKNEVRDDKDFVFLKKIPELHVLEEKDGELIIGATMTLTELAESELLNSRYAAIAQAASLTASPQIRNIATVGGNIMQDRRCIYFNQPHLWRSGLAYCFKTGGSICHQIPNSPVCRAIYYSDVATALIAYEAEVEYIEDGETHRTDLKSLIERHSVANGLACHEHLPILVTRFFVPAAEEGERSGFYKYAMRTTIDFPIINFALRCGGKRPARLAAGAVAPHPVVMAETAAKIDSDATDDEVIAQAEDELRKLAMPIKEACMTPAVKRSLYRHVTMLLNLRKEAKKGPSDRTVLFCRRNLLRGAGQNGLGAHVRVDGLLALDRDGRGSRTGGAAFGKVAAREERPDEGRHHRVARASGVAHLGLADGLQMRLALLCGKHAVAAER